MEVDNEYGLVYFALGMCLFSLKGKQAFDLLTGNFEDG